jgi:addiction module HigA family antidote
MAKQKILAPGDVLKEKILEYQLSVRELAQDLKVNPSSIRQITDGKTKISIPVAFRLAKYFNTPVQYWIDLQASYEIAELKKDTDFQTSLREIPKAKKKKVIAAPASSAKSKKLDDSAKKGTRAPKGSKAAEEASSAGTKRRGRPAAAKDALDADIGAEQPKRRGRRSAAAKDALDADVGAEPKRRGRPAAVKDDADNGAKQPKRRGRKPAAAKGVEEAAEAINTEKPKPKTILIKKNSISPPPSNYLFEDAIIDDDPQT